MSGGELAVRCAVVRWLATAGWWPRLTALACRWRDASAPPPAFRCALQLDFQLLQDSFPLLAKWLLLEPMRILQIFREQIILTMETYVHREIIVQPEQIITSIRLNSLPQGIKELQYNNNKWNRSGVLTITGVLTAISEKKKYLRKTVWKCSECENCYKILRGLPYKEVQCSNFRHIMEEMTKLREFEEYFIVSILNMKASKTNRTLENAKNIIVSDDLISGLELGREYSVTVVCNFTELIAWNLEPKPYRPNYPFHITDKLRKISSSADNNSWSFTYLIASQLSRNELPSNCFYHIRMGLLLSLANIQFEEKYTPISILALENNTLIANTLMTSAAKYAYRAVPIHQTCMPLNNQTTKDGQEIGGLMLPKDGICLLGNWASHNASAKNYFIIKTAIDTEKIQLDDSKDIPLKCSVWTYWDANQNPTHAKQFAIMNNLFGVMYFIDNEDDNLAEFILNKAVDMDYEEEYDNNMALNDDDLKNIFQLIINWRVEMESNAERLLRDYFVAIRKDKPGHVPIRILSILRFMSKAHARLSLRTCVTMQDVSLAIYLHQSSLITICGVNEFGVPLMKHINNINEVNDFMNEFDRWLNNYIKTILGNTASQSQGNEN